VSSRSPPPHLVGRGGTGDEVKLNTGNILTALESLKKKKNGDKGKSSSSYRKKHDDAPQQEALP
jgi:hypothetical protein